MTEIEKELEIAVASVFKPIPLPKVSLTEQWTKLEAIDRELRNRIHRERMMLIAECNRLAVETNSDYDRRIDDAVTKLEAERHVALQTLGESTAEKLHEHDLLIKRMNRDTP